MIDYYLKREVVCLRNEIDKMYRLFLNFSTYSKLYFIRNKQTSQKQQSVIKYSLYAIRITKRVSKLNPVAQIT